MPLNSDENKTIHINISNEDKEEYLLKMKVFGMDKNDFDNILEIINQILGKMRRTGFHLAIATDSHKA